MGLGMDNYSIMCSLFCHICFFLPYTYEPRLQDLKAPVWQHHAIAGAIRQRDIEQARVILRQHLQKMHYVKETHTSV